MRLIPKTEGKRWFVGICVAVLLAILGWILNWPPSERYQVSEESLRAYETEDARVIWQTTGNRVVCQRSGTSIIPGTGRCTFLGPHFKSYEDALRGTDFSDGSKSGYACQVLIDLIRPVPDLSRKYDEIGHYREDGAQYGLRVDAECK